MAENALIVGAGSGLSRALAELLHSEGMNVGLAARDTGKLGDLAGKTNAKTYACDASEPNDVDKLFAAYTNDFGAPDVVVYNPSYRVRGPFNLSTTQLETAEAALRDQPWIDHCRSENARLRVWLAEALAQKGVPSDTTMTNFLLARFRDADEATACHDHMQAQGVLIRKVAGYGLPACLRITIGDQASCQRVAHLVGTFREAQS